METLAPNCYNRECKHYLGVIQTDEDDESSEILICNAFPEGTKGIPEEIAYGDEKHLVKYPGQKNDIVYEKFIEPDEQ